jgi:cyclophilin family peptidyl-prolyl cis-trans isomerase
MNRNNLKYILLSLSLVLVIKTTFSQTFSKETIVIYTSYGDLKIKLYNETPKHRDNFLKLVREKFYDSLLFHRVIEEFMIQGGDPDSKHAESIKLLGDGDLNYSIPAEINSNLYHKKGALCAARNSDEENPERASSACQFYIVQGKTRTEEDLKSYEKRINKAIISKLKDSILNKSENKELKLKMANFKEKSLHDSIIYYSKIINKWVDDDYVKVPHFTFSNEHKNTYITIGGTPHLDSQYTVFGEVIEGLDVINKIASAGKNRDDRPLFDIRMTIRILND